MEVRIFQSITENIAMYQAYKNVYCIVNVDLNFCFIVYTLSLRSSYLAYITTESPDIHMELNSIKIKKYIRVNDFKS